MDDGDDDSVQVAALSWIGTAGLGSQCPPHRQMEERERLSQCLACGVRHGRHQPVEWRRHAGGRGDADPVIEPGAQTIPRIVGQYRQSRDGAVLQRHHQERGLRLQVWPHAGPRAGCDGQHRLRAGRGRHAAGQSHPLQPVLSGEARFLPRGSRDLPVRRRRDRRAWRRRDDARGADPVLQPPDWPERRPDRAGAHGRPRHRARRPVQHRSAEHRNR